MRVSFAGGGTDLPPFVPGIGGRVVGTAVDIRVRAEVVAPVERHEAIGAAIGCTVRKPALGAPGARIEAYSSP